MGATLTVSLALLIAFSRRAAKPGMAGFYDLASLGYALPGSVLAVGIMLSFTRIDQSILGPLLGVLGQEPRQLQVGSVFALLAAYWVRFLARS